MLLLPSILKNTEKEDENEEGKKDQGTIRLTDHGLKLNLIPDRRRF
jgi:hypothetical protein